MAGWLPVGKICARTFIRNPCRIRLLVKSNDSGTADETLESNSGGEHLQTLNELNPRDYVRVETEYRETTVRVIESEIDANGSGEVLLKVRVTLYPTMDDSGGSYPRCTEAGWPSPPICEDYRAELEAQDKDEDEDVDEQNLGGLGTELVPRDGGDGE